MRVASSVAALSGGGVAVLSVGIAGLFWAAIAAVGLLATGVAVATARQRLASAGAVTLLGTVAGAGLVGLDPGFVLLGTLGTVLAWDAATHGIGLTADLTADGRAARAELVHVGATLVVLAAVAGVTYAVTRLGGDLVTTSAALLFLLVGALLLAVGLEPRGVD